MGTFRRAFRSAGPDCPRPERARRRSIAGHGYADPGAASRSGSDVRSRRRGGTGACIQPRSGPDVHLHPVLSSKELRGPPRTNRVTDKLMLPRPPEVPAMSRVLWPLTILL